MADTQVFIERLNHTRTLQRAAGEAIKAGIRVNTFGATETLLSPGNYASSIFYIHDGLIRGAIQGKKDRITTWFQKEGDLVISPCIFSQRPSEEYIITVSNATLFTLPILHLQKTIPAFPEVAELINLLLSESLEQGHYREFLLRIPSAKDRYTFLSKHENYILEKVPHYLIASYLGITKETFSRIHKGLCY